MLPPNSKDHLRKDAMQCRAKNVMMVGDAIKSVTNGSLHNKNAQVFLRSAQILCQNLCGIVLCNDHSYTNESSCIVHGKTWCCENPCNNQGFCNQQ